MISDGSTSDVPNGKISRMPLNGAWDCKTISSDIQGSQEPDSRDKMFKKVYSRSKSTRSRTSVSMNGGGMEASTSNAGSINLDEATEPKIHGTRRNMNLRVIHEVSKDTSSREKSSSDGDDELPQEEDRLNSRHKVGLRSTRNRRAIDYNRRDMSPEKKKQHQSTRSSWLLFATHEEGSRYIPQLGDEVVYFRQGHQDYINGSNSREIGPWTKGNIRDVDYRPDFLVERSRYDVAMKRDWRCRDKCQVWWENEDEENGNWWDGRIVAVKPKSVDFPDSPWERYSVQYKGDPNALPHSPWELYDPNASMVWEEPHIDDDIRTKLIRALAKLEKSGKKSKACADHYGILKLRQVSQSTTFVNKYSFSYPFPVPLTLDVIQSRLENNYYRRFAAMKHDVEVLLQNAEAYFGRNKDFSMKMRRLSDWFTRTLSL
ncbi:PH-interacting protein [Tanacetum coccineum]